MSSRSLRSGLIKSGDSIARATRQNTTLYKTESGFHQALRVTSRNKRCVGNVQSTRGTKRKRKEAGSHGNKSISCEGKQRTEEINNFEKDSAKEVENENKLAKRKPRMASLNAIAKVNAVLESYVRCDSRKEEMGGTLYMESNDDVFLPTEVTSEVANDVSNKEGNDGEEKSNFNNRNTGNNEGVKRNSIDSVDEPNHNVVEMNVMKNDEDGRSKKSKHEIPVSDTDVVFQRVSGNTVDGGIGFDEVGDGEREVWEGKDDLNDKQNSNVNVVNNSDCKQCDSDSLYCVGNNKLENEVNKNIVEYTEKAIQTEINHKYAQTDLSHLPKLNNPKLCTCNMKNIESSISFYNPTVNQEYSSKSIYMKSSVLAYTNNHTLVVPVKKRHILSEKENEYRKPSITKNLSVLLDACINNTLSQNNLTCSKLVYIAQFDDQSTILDTSSVDYKNEDLKSNEKTRCDSLLQVPSLDFASISVPDSKHHRNDKKTSKDSTVSSKQKAKSPTGLKKQKCNGWQFEGEPLEETYYLGNQEITRHYYYSLRRNDEYLGIHDAVILKSGMGRGDADYLARVSKFWEDLSGPHSGDMMMSIYWYYKPEQTNFKLLDTSKMEVYASRHRDDNSVACIVDKCYVLSFTQFCRFQAQKMRQKEKRKKKLKIVPENQNARSCFLPSPDVEESMVYFCRYGYDHRTGKVIKGM